MKITFLLPSDNLTGGARVVAMYARQFMRLGHEVLVLMPGPTPGSWRQRARHWLTLAPGIQAAPGHIALHGIPHRTLDRPGPITARDLPDADLLVATWWETAVWMQAMPASKGRQVHLIQGYEVWLGPHTVAPVHAALRQPNLKLTISHDLRDTLAREVGLEGVQVIPNAIDPVQFDAPARPRKTPPTVGFLYSTAAIKGADVCIQAIALARQRCPELEVLSFGTEPPSPDLPLPAGTRFVQNPPQERLSALYSACDTWLFGSRLDSFGLPVLEAMACRTPVVAVPVGAAPWLLAEGGGTLVPPESPQAMAEALLSLLQGPPNQWERMSDHAHQRAHAHTWADAARQFLAAVER